MSRRESDVLEILGTPHAPGSATSSLVAFTEAVQNGLPWSSAERAQKAFRLTDRELAEILGLSERTLYRHRRSHTPLSPHSSDRLARVVRIVEYAIDVLEDRDAALHWMRRPQRGLGDAVPLTLLQTDYGAREVEHLLGRIDYGVLA